MYPTRGHAERAPGCVGCFGNGEVRFVISSHGGRIKVVRIQMLLLQGPESSAGREDAHICVIAELRFAVAAVVTRQ